MKEVSKVTFFKIKSVFFLLKANSPLALIIFFLGMNSYQKTKKPINMLLKKYFCPLDGGALTKHSHELNLL